MRYGFVMCGQIAVRFLKLGVVFVGYCHVWYSYAPFEMFCLHSLALWENKCGSCTPVTS